MYIAVCIASDKLSGSICQAIEQWKSSEAGRILSLRCFYSSEDMVTDLKNGYIPDGIFMGTEFPDDTSLLDTVREIRNINFFLPIFLTSFCTIDPDLLCKTNAKRFLLYPFESVQISECLQMVTLYIKHRQEYIWNISTGKKMLTLYVDSIVYLASDLHDTVVHTTFDKQITFRKPFNSCLSELSDHGFIQCHRCYIVNISFVRCIKGNNVIMSNGDELPIGRKYKKLLMNHFISP